MEYRSDCGFDPHSVYCGWPLEWWGCFYGQAATVNNLLAMDSTNIGWTDPSTGRTVLHWLALWRVPALASAHKQLAERILEDGTLGAHAPDRNGKTATDLASSAGNSSIVEAIPAVMFTPVPAPEPVPSAPGSWFKPRAAPTAAPAATQATSVGHQQFLAMVASEQCGTSEAAAEHADRSNTVRLHCHAQSI